MSSGRASRATATRTVSARSRAEIPVVMPRRPSMLTVNAVCRGERLSAAIIVRPELRDALLGQRQADEPAPLARHEVDRLGRDQIGGHHQVALVLAILVVDEDHHPAGADLTRSRARPPRGVRPDQRTRPYLRSASRGAGVARARCAELRRHQPIDVLDDHVRLEVHRRRPRACRRASSPRACAGSASPRTRRPRQC